jgi:hypothetical protein
VGTSLAWPLRAFAAGAEMPADDEFVNVAVRSSEVLPGRAWVPEQFYVGSSQFFDGR